MDFPSQFEEWLRQALTVHVPADVRAFSFNLFEPAGIEGVKFGVEIVGTGEFAPEDPDWACNEVWEPAHRRLNIPVSFSGKEWQQCLEAVEPLIQGALAKQDSVATALKSRAGVGFGFVDGDLDIIWQSKQSA
jgi:hypothetical protein